MSDHTESVSDAAAAPPPVRASGDAPRVRSGITVAERLDYDLLRDLNNDIDFINEQGGFVLFAVDAYDILRYCFPIAPFEINSGPRFDIKAQADYFAALAFVLHHEVWRPILLPEYLGELHAFASSLLSRFGAGGVTDGSLGRAVENEVGSLLPDLPEAPSGQDLLEFLKQNFDLILLMVAAGTSHIGFNELEILLRSRLLSLSAVRGVDGVPSKLQAVFERFAAEYRPNSSFIGKCEEAFRTVYSVREGEGTRRGSNRADAVALDRVLQLNEVLKSAYHEEMIEKPYRVVLLSSSSRMRRLVGELERSYTVEDTTYHPDQLRVIRVPDQVFVFAIAHPPRKASLDREGSVDDRAGKEVIQTIKWLMEIHQHAHTMRAKSIWNTDVNEKLALLDVIRSKFLEPYQDSYENLALFALLQGPLRDSLRSVPPSRRIKVAVDNEMVNRLRAIFTQHKDIGSLADTALQSQRKLVRLHTIIAHRWCVAIETGSSPDIAEKPPQDRIRGAYHALPWLIRVNDERLRQAVQHTRDAFFQHPDVLSARREKLVEAFNSLVEIDAFAEVGGNQQAEETDLVRALLFLALSDPASEATAVRLARDVVQRAARDTHLDARYVLTWALRRVEDFEGAERTASEAIEQNPDDPRFWHGRALATFASVHQSGNVQRYVSIKHDLREALRYYREFDTSSEDMRTVMVAGCLNGLCYISTLETNNRDHLKQAREYLVQLKDVLARPDWGPRFPEFFHTEAFLEFMEAKKITSTTARNAKLRNAENVLQHALHLAPARNDYRDLLRKIRQTH